MGDSDSGYDKYCKENDEQWEKDKQIKVCIKNETIIFYQWACLEELYLSKGFGAITFNT